MGINKPILCGKCQAIVESGFERNGEMWAACPICGQQGRFADIRREAAQYYADKGTRMMYSYSSQKPPRIFSWITGD